MQDSESQTTIPAAVPDVAEALRRQRQQIVDQWLAANLPAAGEEQEGSRRLLGVDIQTWLSQAAAHLAGEEGGDADWRPSQPLTQTSGPVGRPATAAEMLRAYATLRAVMLEQVTLELGRDLRGEELVAIDREIDELMIRYVASALDRQLADLRMAGSAQSKYMSFLSHDLRGSLNGMILMLEVVRRELAGKPEFAESLEDLSIVRQSILDTVGTMERHVSADRLRTGRFEARPQRLGLADLVREASARLGEQAAADRLRVEIPPNAVVEVDRELAITILQNVLDNAVRHGRGEVQVRARRVGARWEVSIADAGPGIDPTRLEQLMDPVKRAEIRERGLGLVLAKFAARAAGATLEAESAVGRGSTFRTAFLAAD